MKTKTLHLKLLMAISLLFFWGQFTFPAFAAPQVQAPPLGPASAGEDYAFDNRGFFWDFSSTDHFAVEYTNKLESKFNGGYTLENGWFKGVNSTGNSRIWLLTPHFVDPVTGPINNSQYEGSYRPILPAKYSYLTLQLCVNQPTFIYTNWYNNDFPASSSHGMAYQWVESGCHVLQIDLNNNPGSGQTWRSFPYISGLEVQVSVAGTNIDLNYARLTANKMAGPIDINWLAKPGTVNLSFSDSPALSGDPHDTPIVSGINANLGAYTWSMPHLQP